jgi:hypothetical protein
VVTAPAVVTLQAFGQEHVAELMRDAVDPNRFIYKGLPGRETS